jgi:hypothetical protein
VEGLFRNVLLSTTSSSQASRKEERFGSFQDRVEYATRHGHDHQRLHQHQGVTQKGAMRARYVEDYTFMLDSLGRLGLELRAYPGGNMCDFVSFYHNNCDLFSSVTPQLPFAECHFTMQLDAPQSHDFS